MTPDTKASSRLALVSETVSGGPPLTTTLSGTSERVITARSETPNAYTFRRLFQSPEVSSESYTWTP